MQGPRGNWEEGTTYKSWQHYDKNSDTWNGASIDSKNVYFYQGTPQVISTDRHTVKPWFQGRLPFSFNLPDAAALPPDTALKGADLTYFNGQPAALLLFTIHKHQVSIFLTQRANGPILTALPTTHAGFTIQSTTTRELCILAVSDVNPADLGLLVASLARAQANT